MNRTWNVRTDCVNQLRMRQCTCLERRLNMIIVWIRSAVVIEHTLEWSPPPHINCTHIHTQPIDISATTPSPSCTTWSKVPSRRKCYCVVSYSTPEGMNMCAKMCQHYWPNYCHITVFTPVWDFCNHAINGIWQSDGLSVSLNCASNVHTSINTYTFFTPQ